MNLDLDLARMMPAICDLDMAANTLAWSDLDRAGITRELMQELVTARELAGPPLLFERAPDRAEALWNFLTKEAGRATATAIPEQESRTLNLETTPPSL